MLIICVYSDFQAVGFVEALYQPSTKCDPYEMTLLAIKLGRETRIDEVLKGSTQIMARLGSEEKMGVVFNRMPVVTEDLLKLHPFVGFPGGKDDDGLMADYWLKYDEDGEEDDFKNEWAPKKYDCLAYVNWDISPKAEVREVAAGKRAATSTRGAVAKTKKKTADDVIVVD